MTAKKSYSNNWQEALLDGNFRFSFLISATVFSILLILYSGFVNGIETRSGAILSDPVLGSFSPVNLTIFTFLVLYGTTTFALWHFIRRPQALLLCLNSYAILVIIRMGAMQLAPFEPPHDMIALSDPLVQFFGTGKVLTKDLFFSGHTATALIFCFCAVGRQAKIIFLVSGIAIAIMVLAQHVHYTLDVYSAPFFTYAAYRAGLALTDFMRKY